MPFKSFNKFIKKWNTIKRQVEKALIGSSMTDKLSHSLTEPHNIHFKNLQKCFLLAFSFATFADWLQGPYMYKVYSDYGYDDDLIAILYISGFASSCIFGTVVGQLADKCGRKILCSAFSVLYTACCLSKTSSSFVILLLGRVFGGVSTSILFTTFEAWYLNEHLNFYKFPAEWLNATFTKATFYNGLSAIVAGIVTHISAEYFNFGPVSPYLISIPFLLLSLLIIQSTWKEHSAIQTKSTSLNLSCRDLIKLFFSPLLLLLEDEYVLLYLGFIQCIFESSMYMFIFSWTPILTSLKPPLGLVFSFFMIALMIGSKCYVFLVSKKCQPYTLLTLSVIIAASSFLIVTVSLTKLVNHVMDHEADLNTVKGISLVCFFSFLLYEFSVGMYFPAVSVLRGRIVPEEFRATLTNWFRFPMNIITCATLTIKRGNHTDEVTALRKFQLLFFCSTMLLIVVIFMSLIFSKKFSRKVIRDDIAVVRSGVANQETV